MYLQSIISGICLPFSLLSITVLPVATTQNFGFVFCSFFFLTTSSHHSLNLNHSRYLFIWRHLFTWPSLGLHIVYYCSNLVVNASFCITCHILLHYYYSFYLVYTDIPFLLCFTDTAFSTNLWQACVKHVCCHCFSNICSLHVSVSQYFSSSYSISYFSSLLYLLRWSMIVIFDVTPVTCWRLSWWFSILKLRYIRCFFRHNAIAYLIDYSIL